jgi:hypothetical protein
MHYIIGQIVGLSNIQMWMLTIGEFVTTMVINHD